MTACQESITLNQTIKTWRFTRRENQLRKNIHVHKSWRNLLLRKDLLGRGKQPLVNMKWKRALPLCLFMASFSLTYFAQCSSQKHLQKWPYMYHLILFVLFQFTNCNEEPDLMYFNYCASCLSLVLSQHYQLVSVYVFPVKEHFSKMDSWCRSQLCLS